MTTSPSRTIAPPGLPEQPPRAASQLGLAKSPTGHETPVEWSGQ